MKAKKVSSSAVIDLFLVSAAMTVNSNINRLFPALAEIRRNTTVKSHANHLLSLADQPLLGERVTNCIPGKSPPTPSGHLWSYSKWKCFHQWAIVSVITVLPNSAIDSDLTDVYLHENIPDYHVKGTHI